METITPIVATEANYLEILDTKNVMETLELAASIVRYFKNNYLEFNADILARPWHWSEYWVPALNNDLSDLSGDLSEYQY